MVGVAVPPYPRILPEVVQRVVHPAHVPLIIKAQSAVFYRTGHALIVGGVFCDQHAVRMQLVQSLIHAFQERDAGGIDAAAGIAAPVDQPADCVHTQPVKVENRQPVVGTGLEKTAHFAAGVDKVAAAPFAVVVLFLRILI